MDFAMLKPYLSHWITTEAMAENADSRFGLTAAILPLAKSIFFKTLLKLLGVTRRDSVEDVLFFEIVLVGFAVEATISGDQLYIYAKFSGDTLMAILK